jgi:thiol-disulfide isomerase/thioredoxin
VRDYPQSPNRWEARMALMQIGNSLAMLQDQEPDLAAQSKELRAIADDKEAPLNIRADAGLVLLQIASVDFDRVRTEAAARELSAAIAKFLETHPDDARRPALRLTEAQALENFDAAAARTIYEEVAGDEDPDIAQAAKSGLDLMEMRAQPLELSFTAVDGRKVDLADLRGKVVLVDFWATWCPPCVEEAPQLVEIYEQFKDRGFEIVGVSLDNDKGALEKFTAENKMNWPQFFDGKGWDNELAQRFKIQSVPTMWLLGKDGKLADPSPRNRLEQAVTAALEKP